MGMPKLILYNPLVFRIHKNALPDELASFFFNISRKEKILSG